jgi:hypothetical protein
VIPRANDTISLNASDQLSFVMDMSGVYFAVQIELLNIV